MDSGDKVQRLEEQLAGAARPSQKSHTPQLMIGGEVCCVDCYDPIDQERLKAQPEAVRCIDCQIRFESKGRIHGH